jgi:uncharacterized protein involved in tolerance to divalent cations
MERRIASVILLSMFVLCVPALDLDSKYNWRNEVNVGMNLTRNLIGQCSPTFSLYDDICDIS